ncbi:T9SS type A sorting domain-containing protein [Flavobacterium sp. RHBU_24]|uniref:T9SS type A sorting domain-containing protein n=1 Tax=Flavobacterium sp. RHBU_24 TaxID=3391185 RepID=UPI00398501C2
MIKPTISFLFVTGVTFAQSVIGHNNSGSVNGPGLASSVGEIYVVPQNQNNTSAGTLAAATQVVLGNLGVNDYAVMEGVTYYPNPVQNLLTIDVKQGVNLANAQVYDAKGTQITLPRANGNTLDFSSLTAGVYFISFPETKLKPIKIVKN